MGRIAVLVIILSVVVGGKRSSAESQIPDTKDMEHTAQLLARWRDVRQLVWYRRSYE